MTKKFKDCPPSMTHSEFDVLLRKIAVAHGAAIPTTPEEVDLFEEVFSDEIKAASRKIPSLQDTLNLAKKARSSAQSILNEVTDDDIGDKYRMAARNGTDISTDIENIMNAAIKKKKDNK